MLWRAEPRNRIKGGMLKEGFPLIGILRPRAQVRASIAGWISGRKIKPEFCSLPRFTFHVNHTPM